MPLPAKNKFANKPPVQARPATNGAANPTTRPAAKTRGNRFGGLEDPRNPMLEEGDSRVRLMAIEEGFNPGTKRTSFKLTTNTLAYEGSPHEAGFTATVVCLDTSPGTRDFKQAIAHFAGYDDKDEYNAFDPDGDLFEAALGQVNDYSSLAENLIGRVADVRVTNQGDDGKGGWYRGYMWSAVPDEDIDQDQRPKIERG